MTFYEWFKLEGDKLCNFLSLVSLGILGLKGSGPVQGFQVDIPNWLIFGCLIGGVIATAAHQSFFPNSTNGVLK